MKLLKKEWFQLLILAVPFCAVALLWDKLPERVPSHWNIRGEVDGYANKTAGTLMLPLINIFLASFMALVPLINPKLRHQSDEAQSSLSRTIRILRLATTGFFSLMALATLGAAMGIFKNGADFTYYINAGVGLLFVIMGNFMTKLRPNFFVGIRTPWTLSSQEVWVKTHRLGGPLMIIGGLLMLLLILFVPVKQYIPFVLLPIALSITLITTVYSYLLYRKLPPGSTSST